MSRNTETSAVTVMSISEMVFFLLMDHRSDIHKYLRDPRNKNIEFLLKYNPIIKNLNVVLVSRFLAHARSKKRKVIFLLRLLVNPYK